MLNLLHDACLLDNWAVKMAFNLTRYNCALWVSGARPWSNVDQSGDIALMSNLTAVLFSSRQKTSYEMEDVNFSIQQRFTCGQISSKSELHECLLKEPTQVLTYNHDLAASCR